MPTPLFVCDEECGSVTILPQDPERAVHVLKELIANKTIVPKGFEKAYFDNPYEVAPLELVCYDRTTKYNKINILAGFVADHTYVTFIDKIGADVMYNSKFVFEILDMFGFEYPDDVKAILKDKSRLCDENGIYSAQLVSGKEFSYKVGPKTEKIEF